MSDAIKAEIRKLEDRRFQAMIDSDFDTLDKLLGDGLIYTHSTARKWHAGTQTRCAPRRHRGRVYSYHSSLGRTRKATALRDPR
jgi:hypothetical protein